MIIVLDHVGDQFEMSSLRDLSSSIVTSSHLKELLLKIQTYLPGHLRLHVMEISQVIKLITLPDDNKLLVLLVLPSLDRKGNFEIYQVISIAIHFSRAEQRLGLVAKCPIEGEYIALNSK